VNARIFDGISTALKLENELKPKVAGLLQLGKALAIAAILFREDKGSVLYTGLKREAAARLGIGYQVHEFSLTDSVAAITDKIRELNADQSLTGIIIQKPWRRTWESAQTSSAASLEQISFNDWWQRLVTVLDPNKDVDGLSPATLNQVRTGDWQQSGAVLPATCQAVISILEGYTNLFSDTIPTEQSRQRVAIIGKSDLMGTPLFWVLKQRRCDVFLLGKKELKQGIEQKNFLHGFRVIISATGVAGLIVPSLIDEGAVVIDVGEPRGDVATEVRETASFVTPVPGGVGPMTVACLMANCVKLAIRQN
jgi:methylenetetrahydrofolate dehydrogenase (NADP+) / methenyltetrahydrofolate cyclohydrolase